MVPKKIGKPGKYGFIYFARYRLDPDGPVKIGQSANPQKRMDTLFSDLITTIPNNDLRLEWSILNLFQERKAAPLKGRAGKREWFDITESDIQFICSFFRSGKVPMTLEYFNLLKNLKPDPPYTALSLARDAFGLRDCDIARMLSCRSSAVENALTADPLSKPTPIGEKVIQLFIDIWVDANNPKIHAVAG